MLPDCTSSVKLMSGILACCGLTIMTHLCNPVSGSYETGYLAKPRLKKPLFVNWILDFAVIVLSLVLKLKEYSPEPCVNSLLSASSSNDKVPLIFLYFVTLSFKVTETVLVVASMSIVPITIPFADLTGISVSFPILDSFSSYTIEKTSPDCTVSGSVNSA